MVGVLVLVDEDVPESPLVERRDARESPEQVDGLRDEIVEVEGVGTGELARVTAEDLDEDGLCGVGEVGVPRIALDILQLVLGLRDAAGDLAHGEAVGVGVEVLDDALEEGARVGGVVDREAPGVAEALRLSAQDAHARRVEGRDPHALGRLPDERLDAIPHLSGGLVGEGDREDLARPGVARLDEVGDAPREHARLARSCPGDDEKGLSPIDDGLALRRVEALEQPRLEVRGGLLGDEGHDPPILDRAADGGADRSEAG